MAIHLGSTLESRERVELYKREADIAKRRARLSGDLWRREQLLAEARFIEAALIPISERGYREINPEVREGWKVGWVFDPRPFKRLSIYSNLVMLSSWLIISLFCLLIFELPLDISFLLGIGLSSLVRLLCYRGMLKKNQESMRKAGIPLSEAPAFLKTPLPTKVRNDCLRAKRLVERGLFDRIQVLAPDNAFVYAREEDPLIFAVRGDRKFFVAEFNVASELS